jgi:ATP-dependent DNA helicase RecG
VEDALYYLPARYEDRSKVVPIKDVLVGASFTVQGQVSSCGARRGRSGLPIFQITVKDDTGNIKAVWFNRPYLKDSVKTGDRLILYGRVELYDKPQMVQPEFEILEETEKDSVNIGRIVPVYPLTEDLTQRHMRALIYEALQQHARQLTERLPTYMIAREKLVDIKFAIRNIHFPSNFGMLEKAYRRVVFEEFLVLQLALALRKANASPQASTAAYSVRAGIQEGLKGCMPFELTPGQKKAVSDIERDMSRTRPMNRLLEGDVGSGKTVVAAHALMLAVSNGSQGVIMAPTELLARQHFLTLSEFLMPLGIRVELLVGGMDPGMKKSLYNEISSGAVNILVGTHAVIQEGVEFKRLGLAVIDEQHKFGVRQRAVLREKGRNPHVLIMTATPIPRTLALTVYGDLDISVIRELPKGRKPISTYWIEEDKRDSAYGFIKEELDKGRQAYVVCPLIDRASSAASAVEVFERLKAGAFSGYDIALLHGRMPSDEKDRVMKDFKKGRVKVLVSTVVIEVGIDIPNATVMLVENAERFGLSQLHQLRGRIGRAGHESYCILSANPTNDAAAKRLKTIEDTIDGFEIAEADMDIRGPGEIFGTRQHGLPEIRFGNIARDFDIMEAARKEAFELVKRDPGMNEEHHRPLKAVLNERFKGRLELIKVG